MYLAAAALLSAAALVHWAAKPVAYDSESSWVQLLTDAVLLVAVLTSALLAWRMRSRGRDEWTVVAMGTGATAFLAWREIEPDNLLCGVHLFSFAYVLKPDEKVPLPVKLALGVIGGLIIVAVCWWLVRRRREILRNLLPLLRGRWPVVLATAAVLGITAQVLDRAESVERNFGVTLPGTRAPDKRGLRNVEEMLELASALLILCAVIESRFDLLAAKRRS